MDDRPTVEQQTDAPRDWRWDHEIRCLDCSWRYLVSDLTVRECYIDPLDFHEREHSRDTSKVGRAHLHFARTRRAFTDG